MQQSQIIGISILFGGCGGKFACIDIKKKVGQDRSLVNAVSQTSKPVLLAITGGKGEASIWDKLQDHPEHVLIWQKSRQLAGEATVPDSAISRCQVDKHGAGLLFGLKRVLDILREQNGLVHG